MKGTNVPFFIWINFKSNLVQQIEQVIAELFKEEEFEDCYLIELKVATSGTKIEVFIDCDSGLSLRKCQRISRHLEAFIEEESLMPEKYFLDVSSPGIDRPLMIPRQYIKNVGRKIVVKRNEEKEVKGKLIEADEEKIVVAVPLTRKKQKETGQKEALEEINYKEILNAKIQISF